MKQQFLDRGRAATLALPFAVAGLTFALVDRAEAADTYAMDLGHSEIRFSWDHVGLSTQSGEFRDFEGTLVFDEQDITKSKISVTIKADSLDSGVEALDKHMKSADMFEVEKYPEITFESTEVRQTGKNIGRVIGNLTIKDQTHPVALDVTFNFAGDHPLAPFIEAYAGAKYVAFSAATSLLRSDFGVGYATPLTSDKIDIVIETEMRGQN